MEAMLSEGLGQESLAHGVIDALENHAPRKEELSGKIQAIQGVIYGDNNAPSRVRKSVMSGRYRWEKEGSPHWVDGTFNPTVCGPGEAIVLARSEGQWVGPQGEKVRIQCMGDETALSPWIEWVRNQVVV
jgi:hypothetical protein